MCPALPGPVRETEIRDMTSVLRDLVGKLGRQHFLLSLVEASVGNNIMT